MICTARQILFGLANQRGRDGRACGMHGERRNAYTVLVEKPEE
jgi:hypothetical protein